jgi:hypothetical protein
MAATISFTRARSKDYSGIRARVVCDYTGPSSYATGGDPLTPSDVKLGTIEHLTLGVAVNASGASPRLLVYDYTNQKVLWFVPNTGSEVAAATDLSGYTVALSALGKG